ncbi:hypothetical protein SDC9_89239 [bioreactor metagenome]|uniref:Copper amine oxidase-like N-terminal domain-containing protein n=1 Tax=bioreactor metagenome TaxID=1076179 RepID=A0A644ZVA9_9ZZZZ
MLSNSVSVFAASKNDYIANLEIKIGTNEVVFDENGNSETITYDGEVPFIDDNGRVQIPLRYASDILCEPNLNIYWKEKTKTAYLYLNDYVDNPIARVTIGSNIISHGDEETGTTTQMDSEPIIKNGRIFIPLRYILNAMGIDDDHINWDEDIKTIKITKTKYNYSVEELRKAFEKLDDGICEKYGIVASNTDLTNNCLEIGAMGLNDDKINRICEYLNMNSITFINEDGSTTIDD